MDDIDYSFENNVPSPFKYQRKLRSPSAGGKKKKKSKQLSSEYDERKPLSPCIRYKVQSDYETRNPSMPRSRKWMMSEYEERNPSAPRNRNRSRSRSCGRECRQQQENRDLIYQDWQIRKTKSKKKSRLKACRSSEEKNNGQLDSFPIIEKSYTGNHSYGGNKSKSISFSDSYNDTNQGQDASSTAVRNLQPANRSFVSSTLLYVGEKVFNFVEMTMRCTHGSNFCCIAPSLTMRSTTEKMEDNSENEKRDKQYFFPDDIRRQSYNEIVSFEDDVDTDLINPKYRQKNSSVRAVKSSKKRKSKSKKQRRAYSNSPRKLRSQMQYYPPLQIRSLDTLSSSSPETDLGSNSYEAFLDSLMREISLNDDTPYRSKSITRDLESSESSESLENKNESKKEARSHARSRSLPGFSFMKSFRRRKSKNNPN